MLEGKRKAVVVGINKYKDQSPPIPTLEGAENDATEMYELLRNPEIGNFDIPIGHYLIGKEATCEKIRKAISDVFWQNDLCDLALFYFSGHGFVDSYEDGYIAPYDISHVEPFVCGINMENLKDVISKSICKSAIIILDCCHSGIAAETNKSIEDVTKKIGNLLKDKDAVLSRKGRVILSSSEGNQTSKEISKQKHRYRNETHPHGTFSYYLIEGIDGEASKDVESGIITLDKLFKYAADETEKQGKQRPISSSVDAGPLERIEIAIATDKYKKYIQNLIKEAESEFNKGDISNLIFAVRDVCEVIKRDTKNDDANKLKNKINDALINQQGPVGTWLISNLLDLRHDIGNLLPELRKIIDCLCFDGIKTINQREQLLVIDLYDVSTNKMTKKQFIDDCRKIDQTHLASGVSR